MFHQECPVGPSLGFFLKPIKKKIPAIAFNKNGGSQACTRLKKIVILH